MKTASIALKNALSSTQDCQYKVTSIGNLVHDYMKPLCFFFFSFSQTQRTSMWHFWPSFQWLEKSPLLPQVLSSLTRSSSVREMPMTPPLESLQPQCLASTSLLHSSLPIRYVHVMTGHSKPITYLCTHVWAHVHVCVCTHTHTRVCLCASVCMHA